MKLKCKNCGTFMQRIELLCTDGYKCNKCDWYIDKIEIIKTGGL